MKDSDLIVASPIPFGDMTRGEAKELADTVGAGVARTVDAFNGPAPRRVRSNPEGVYDRFYTPLGKLVIDGSILARVGGAAAKADTIAKINETLDRLLEAVKVEDEPFKTRTGKPKGAPYRNAIAKLKAWLADPANAKLPSKIFTKGNRKLPFWSFSTLPGTTCPGAAGCLTKGKFGGKDGRTWIEDKPGRRGYCYSFSGWRNVYPYFRQLQNTILLRLGHGEIIRKAWAKLPEGTTVRLYVDGDIDSMETLDFWMERCFERPDLNVYGYSKSWHLFVNRHKAGKPWPKNYLLNISDASRFWVIPEMREAIQKVPVYRGIFATIEGVKSKMPHLKESDDFAGANNKKLAGHATHMSEVVAETKKQIGAGAKVFPCPGKCAFCDGGVHACGSEKRKGWIIAIAVH